MIFLLWKDINYTTKSVMLYHLVVYLSKYSHLFIKILKHVHNYIQYIIIYTFVRLNFKHVALHNTYCGN